MIGALYLLVIGLVTAGYVAFGVFVRERGLGVRWLVAGAVLAAVAFGVLAATLRAPGVQDGPFAEGILTAAILAGAVPFAALSSAGRFVPNAIALTIVWAVLSAGATVLLILTALLVAALVGCPPDSYECPF